MLPGLPVESPTVLDLSLQSSVTAKMVSDAKYGTGPRETLMTPAVASSAVADSRPAPKACGRKGESDRVRKGRRRREPDSLTSSKRPWIV